MWGHIGGVWPPSHALATATVSLIGPYHGGGAPKRRTPARTEMLASKKAGAPKERSKDYFRSPRGTFSLPNRTTNRWHSKEEAGERWTGETEKKVALVVEEEAAAPGEARRTNGPKRTSSRGFGNA